MGPFASGPASAGGPLRTERLFCYARNSLRLPQSLRRGALGILVLNYIPVLLSSMLSSFHEDAQITVLLRSSLKF